MSRKEIDFLLHSVYIRSVTGKELKERRKALKLSQTELGTLLGVTQTSIWRWEDGRVPVPVYLDLALRQLEADQKKSK